MRSILIISLLFLFFSSCDKKENDVMPIHKMNRYNFHIVGDSLSRFQMIENNTDTFFFANRYLKQTSIIRQYPEIDSLQIEVFSLDSIPFTLIILKNGFPVMEAYSAPRSRLVYKSK